MRRATSASAHLIAFEKGSAIEWSVNSPWRKVGWGMLVFDLLCGAGCGRTHLQREVVASGTPAHLEGDALVLLPRTCVVRKRLSSRHLPPSGLGARTTLKLRRAIDAMVPTAQRADAQAIEFCTPPPDLSLEPARLSDLRASEHTLRLMRERGLELAVVIEIQTTIACTAGSNGVLLTHYAGAGLGASTAFTGSDTCDDDEIELMAYVFRQDGRAVWAGMREIVPGEPVEPAVERLLQRVPVTMPLFIKHVSNNDLRCVLDDHGTADCT